MWVSQKAFQQGAQETQGSAHGLRCKACRFITKLHLQFVSRGNNEYQWVICLFQRLQETHLHLSWFCSLTALLALNMIILEDDKALKQRLPTRNFAPAMYLHQGTILILACFRLLYLQIHEPRHQFNLWVYPRSHGQCIDE